MARTDTILPWRLTAGPTIPRRSDYSYQLAEERYAEQGRSLLTRGRSPFWGAATMPLEEKQPFPVMNSGVRFLREWAAGDRDKPFFLTVSSAEPHFPHFLPEKYAAIAEALKPSIELPASIGDDCEDRPWFHSVPWWPCMDTSVLDEDEWRRVIAYSHAHIMLVDEAIGRVLDALDELGLSESTTVIFTSDHGDMEGAHNRFDKAAYFYEEVWRIPLIIRTPDGVPANQDAFVSLIDVGETLFDLVGAEETAERPRAGRDLMPLVAAPLAPQTWGEGTAGQAMPSQASPRIGGRGADWPPLAYGVYDLYNGMSFAVRAIRNQRFKYVWNPQDRDELYDLVADPHEMENLAGQAAQSSVEADLRDQLMAWLAEIGDDLPERVDDLPKAGTIVATGEPGP